MGKVVDNSGGKSLVSLVCATANFDRSCVVRNSSLIL
jgi:hypothetical protein